MSAIKRALGFGRGESGATAVEFALVIGPLLLLFVAIIEGGRLMWSANALDEIAINGARCLGIHAPGCAIGENIMPDQTISYIQQAAQAWGLALDPADISLATDAGCAVETGFLRVALALRFDSVLPVLNGIVLTAEACFPSQF